jgi:hypothetical protein
MPRRSRAIGLADAHESEHLHCRGRRLQMQKRRSTLIAGSLCLAKIQMSSWVRGLPWPTIG